MPTHNEVCFCLYKLMLYGHNAWHKRLSVNAGCQNSFVGSTFASASFYGIANISLHSQWSFTHVSDNSIWIGTIIAYQVGVKVVIQQSTQPCIYLQAHA